MNTIIRVMFLALVALSFVPGVVSGAETISNNTYVVNPGDFLGKIARKTGRSTQELWELNKNHTFTGCNGRVRAYTDINRIEPCWELRLTRSVVGVPVIVTPRPRASISHDPSTRSVSVASGEPLVDVSHWRKSTHQQIMRWHPNSNPFTGSLDEVSTVFGLRNPSVMSATMKSSDGRNGTMDCSGQIVTNEGIAYQATAMAFGSDRWKTFDAIAHKECRRNPKHLERVQVYTVGDDAIAVAEACGNPVRIERLHKPEPLRERLKPFCDGEHEATIGAYGAKNQLAKFWGAWGELLCFHNLDPEGQHTVGVGVYGAVAPGNTEAYEWDESRLGMQFAYRNTRFSLDPFEGDLIRQFIAKVRFLLEKTSGGSRVSEYEKDQLNKLINLYAEYVHELDRDTQVGAIFELMYALNSTVSSTWTGEVAESRTSVELLGFVQRRLNKKWDLRVLAGPAFTGWDLQTWFKAVVEFRYDDWIMVGPWVSVPIGGISDEYVGLSAGDLTTIGAFIRVELGTLVRRQREKEAIKQIRVFVESPSSSSGGGGGDAPVVLVDATNMADFVKAPSNLTDLADGAGTKIATNDTPTKGKEGGIFAKVSRWLDKNTTNTFLEEG